MTVNWSKRSERSSYQLADLRPEERRAAVGRVTEERRWRRDVQGGEGGARGAADGSEAGALHGFEQYLEHVEVGGQEGPLGGAVGERAAGGVGMPGEGVPEEDAGGVSSQGSPDDGPRGLEPELRVGARRPEAAGRRPG